MEYDMVFNLPKLEDVVKRSEGWVLSVNNSETWTKNVTNKSQDERIKVGIMGVYNRGKTFITQLLAAADERKLQPNNLKHTEGLSMIFTHDFIFIDTAGQNQSMNLKKTKKKTR